MDGKYIPGKGCTCGAYDASECGCGVDWRSRREVVLETLLAEAVDLLNAYSNLYGCADCDLSHGDSGQDHHDTCKIKRFFDKLNERANCG